MELRYACHDCGICAVRDAINGSAIATSAPINSDTGNP